MTDFGKANDGPPSWFARVPSRAIIDKNCRIGKGVRIDSESLTSPDFDHEKYIARDSIIVAPKDTVFPDGWKS